MAAKLIPIFTSIIIFFTSFTNLFGITNDYSFTVNTKNLGEALPNVASNVNVWDMGTQFINAENDTENDIYEFVEYVQLMECTGGNYSRDLFKDPYDRDVLDDYDFSRLINNCQGILNLGAKPHLKVGNVPMKYTSKSTEGYFEVNLFEPDDYEVYYNYLYSLFKALVDTFGQSEVLTWRFGVMTEYENSDWFDCGDAESSFKAYCKIYDYAVAAMQEAIGENVYVGAHSMTVTDGLWDERQFIEHCAKGTNAKTGKTGTRICYLAFSYYEGAIGAGSNGMSIGECADHLRSAAEKCGLNNLSYGIDEGRVYGGAKGRTDSQLLSRTVGYQWQAATDAKLFTECFDSGVSYFSTWYYKSNGLNSGNPSQGFHIAKLISKWKDANRAQLSGTKSLGKTKVNAISAVKDDKIYVMAYNYKNEKDYSKPADITFDIILPENASKSLNVTAYKIDKNCNYFDDWLCDKEAYGIPDEAFDWSPDCICIGANITDPTFRAVYHNELAPKYKQCSQLVPTHNVAVNSNGKATLSTTLGGNEVIFYEIEF